MIQKGDENFKLINLVKIPEDSNLSIAIFNGIRI